MSEGGEPVCYLPQVTDDGLLFDPQTAIQIGNEASGGIVIAIGAGQPGRLQFPELAPLPGETREHYLERLEEPGCRTAAWRIALLAEERRVSLSFPDGGAEYAPDLLAYLRALIAE